MPKFHGKAGEGRTTRKGRALGGLYAESYWHADPFDRGEYQSHEDAVEDVLFDVLDRLTPHKSFLLLLVDQGARAHLQVSTHSNRNYALELPPALLLLCAQLGLCLVHDAYPYPKNW